jgi:hypothetical protein
MRYTHGLPRTAGLRLRLRTAICDINVNINQRRSLLFVLRPPGNLGAGRHQHPAHQWHKPPASCEGPPSKKKSTAPPVHLLDPRPTHPPSDFFLDFFLVRFWAFLGKGSSKTSLMFFAKSPCRKLSPNKSTKISMSVFPRLFWLYRVFRCFSAMGVQKHYKKGFAKQIVFEKFL